MPLTWMVFPYVIMWEVIPSRVGRMVILRYSLCAFHTAMKLSVWRVARYTAADSASRHLLIKIILPALRMPLDAAFSTDVPFRNSSAPISDNIRGNLQRYAILKPTIDMGLQSCAFAALKTQFCGILAF